MFARAISRLLMAMLLVAVVAKPCMGLLSGSAHAKDMAAIALDLSDKVGGEATNCDKKCFAARIEEVGPDLYLATTLSSADWTLSLDTQTNVPINAQSLTRAPPDEIDVQKVKQRLAVLGRFLL